MLYLCVVITKQLTAVICQLSKHHNSTASMLESIFFISCVITIWNQLPAEVLNAVTVAALQSFARAIYLVICYRF